MCPDQHENQSDPELLIDVEESEIVRDGFAVRVRGGGTVRYFGDGFKTREIAWGAGREFVKKFLRAQLQQATGVSVRAERPAFKVCCVPGCTKPVNAGGLFCDGCGICTRCRKECLPHKSGLCWTCWQLADAAARVDDLTLQRWAHGAWPGASDPLEDEQLCTCDHAEGIHEVLLGPCWFLGCKCEGFTPVAQVEAVL